MDRHGGSISRVLHHLDLPFAILEQRELIIPLQAQFRLLERAAKEIGDGWLGARLGQSVKSAELSAFGMWVCAAPTLGHAIARAHAGLHTMLQTSTILKFSSDHIRAQWSIEFVEPETDGRHHNEFLGLGYMIDVVRMYAGPRWVPSVVRTALPKGTPRRELEEILGTNVSHGHAVPAIEFDARLVSRTLYARLPSTQPPCSGEPSVPAREDLLAAVSAVIELAMAESYPRINWVADNIGMTRRSLQRRLRQHGTTFNQLSEFSLASRARELLETGSEGSITAVALRLGYADPAHFARAFRRWTGMSPTLYQKQYS